MNRTTPRFVSIILAMSLPLTYTRHDLASVPLFVRVYIWRRRFQHWYVLGPVRIGSQHVPELDTLEMANNMAA